MTSFRSSCRPGDEIELDAAVEALANAAYTRTDLVEKRGDFAVRGGILDVFPPTEEHPLRVEFWGDTVEEVRYFKVADQRSLEIAEHGVWAPPCRELLLTEELRGRARALAKEQPGIADMLVQLAEGIAVEGMESLTPALVDRMELLVDLLPENTHVVLCDPERIRTRAADLVATSQEFLEASWATAAGGGTVPIDLGAAAYRTLAEVREHAVSRGVPWWSISPFSVDEELDEDTIASGVRAPESYRGDTQRALVDAKGWLEDNWRLVYVSEGHGPAERFVEVLRGEGVPARLAVSLTAKPERNIVTVTTGQLDHGIVVPAAAARRRHRSLT